MFYSCYYHSKSSSFDSISLRVSSLNTICKIKIAIRVASETPKDKKNNFPSSLFVPPNELVEEKSNPFLPLK